MIQKRKMALTMASLIAMSGASAVFARDSSDEARQRDERSAQHRQSNADERDRRNRQADASNERNQSSYGSERRRDDRRWRSSSDWDALGEFDTRGRERLDEGPRLRDLEEGSGYTYRDRNYDPYDARQRHYDPYDGESSYTEYMRQDRYRDNGWAMRDRMRDARGMDRNGYSDGYGQRYDDDRRFSRSRGGDRDRYIRTDPRYSWYEERAIGPRGWRGDIDDGLITQGMSSLYEDRGAIGPQGWQPGMNADGHDDARRRGRAPYPSYAERDDPVRYQAQRLRGRSMYDIHPRQGLTDNRMQRDWMRNRDRMMDRYDAQANRAR